VLVADLVESNAKLNADERIALAGTGHPLKISGTRVRQPHRRAKSYNVITIGKNGF
jgi:hypothetical protein